MWRCRPHAPAARGRTWTATDYATRDAMRAALGLSPQGSGRNPRRRSNPPKAVVEGRMGQR